MLKKIIPVLLLLFSPVCWSQFYAGVGVGPEMTVFGQRTHVVNSNIDVKNSTQLSGAGKFASIFAGYGFLFRNFYYLGAEINGGISSDDFSSSNKEFVHRNFSSTTYKMNNSLGISLLPGIFVTDSTLLYCRLGYSNSHFKISTSDSSLNNMSKNLSGFRYGIGLNQAIFSNFSMRIECSSNLYRAVASHVLDAVSNTTIDTNITPQMTQVEIGLIYNFV
jgi:outer membrane immunogenic protein